MLGSLTDAEDAVQETWLRWERADRAQILEPRAWLTTVTGRICVDVLKSARVTREAYVGPWLPEPLVERLPSGDDPSDVAVLDDSVRIALLHLLERLTPEQRVAFVLHDVFGVPFDAVASALGTKVESARQLASRARRLLHDNAPPRLAPLPDQRATIEAFFAACQGGDLGRLATLLAPDVELHSDGGGRVRAALRPIMGVDKVSRFLSKLMESRGPLLRPEPALVNGQFGVVFWFTPAALAEPSLFQYMNERMLFGVVVPDVDDDGRISRISFILNPEKLQHLVPAGAVDE
jgi:RNA polymerase sigma-70 factor (ECF subfamily)